MVDLTFSSRAKNFVPLSLLKYIASLRASDDDGGGALPEEIAYIGAVGMKAIKGTLSFFDLRSSLAQSVRIL